MISKLCSLTLVVLLVNVTCVSMAVASGKAESKLSKSEAKIRKSAAKVKKGVIKLGVSTESKVQVKLRDKTKVKGHISKIDENTFTVVDKYGESHVIEYTNAKQITGNNLHSGVWVAIGVGIAVVVILIILDKALD